MLLLAGTPHVILFPENVTLPLGENGTFLCTSAADVTYWKVNNTTINTERFLRNRTLMEEYKNRGIFISNFLTSGDNYTSRLTITGDERNNFTKIQCAIVSAIFDSIDFDEDQAAFLRVFGKV